MTSPYSSGGGGTHLEARVAAYYIAAALTEAPARGVPGQYVVEAMTQRAAFGDPLDDVIVVGQFADGTRAKLHLQVKSDLSFTDKDSEWVSVLQQAWVTFTGTFDSARDRLGVAIGTYNARADKHYRAVLNWAAHSVDGSHFTERITKKDFSHQDKDAFVASVRGILENCASDVVVNDDTLWRFLRCFEIVHFDFAATTSSRDVEAARDRLRGYLPDGAKDKAGDIWSYLVAHAGELIPVGGGATRATLVHHLQSNGLPTGTAGRFRKDIQAIDQESKRALATIKGDIHGLRLHRADSYDKVREVLAAGRFIQIEGEPGTGKSALLKQIAEETARFGAIFVLKDTRIQPRGWAAHATQLGVTSDLVSLMVELGAVADPILFIDGIDKISDQATQLTVNDLVIAIATEPVLARWKVVATVREQNLKHVETWLSPDALKQLPIRTVSVPPVGGKEISTIYSEFPRLRPLLLESGNVDLILRRPFFLEAMLTLAGRAGTTSLPASEVELLKLWWTLGGADRPDFTPAQSRRNVLMNLAERLAAAPDAAIPIRDLPPEPLSDLASVGVIRDVRLGHSVGFTHDIYEEWALCELLLGEQEPISALLKRLKEPQLLVRPIQLLGSFLLESYPTEKEWQAIYEDVSGDASLRPVWQRAILTSSLQSTRSTSILAKLAGYLHESGHGRLKRLLMALRTLEVVPNQTFLDERTFPDLEPDTRVKYAHLSAVPKVMVWLRFLDWYLPYVGEPPPSLIPDLVPVFSTWQSTCGGKNIRHCKRIGEIAHAWLTEFEEAGRPDSPRELRDPFGLDLSHEEENELEQSLRALFLSAAGDVPDLVKSYLVSKANHKHRHMFREEILKSSASLAVQLPTDLVDYILRAFLEHPEETRGRWETYSESLMDDLGVADDDAFYPASPRQSPFLVLLQNHEAEGLRLVRELCNHSTKVWRRVVQNGRHHRQSLTPLPLELCFPWGTQLFWGNSQTYMWFRAGAGNHAVQSALMALEQWALDRISSGDEFAGIFRKVIEGNESVAALGVATSLALAHSTESIECALPLITCPNIWVWDITRASADMGGSSPNEIADWNRHRLLMLGVRALNRRPHRRHSIRDLVICYVVSKDAELRERYTQGIRSFTLRPPFEYDEEKDDEAYVDQLRKKMSWFVELADPQYWHSEPTGDGQIKIWNEPPSANNPDRLRLIEEHALLNRCLALALWAHKGSESGALDGSLTLGAALAEARELDSEDLFDVALDPENLVDSNRQSGVAGVAFAFARFAESDVWDEAAAWCFDVLHRASAMPSQPSSITYRGSLWSMHPLIFAVHGFAAMLARNYRVRDCQAALLGLAVDPFDRVVEVVAQSAERYAMVQRDFHWVLYHFFVSRCIFVTGTGPDYHSIVWDDAEARKNLAFIEAAELALDSQVWPDLPDIPMPWVKRPDALLRAETDQHHYVRNDDCLDRNLAEKTFLSATVTPILATSLRRKQFVRFVRQLVDFSIQTAMPPFAHSRRDYRANVPYDWMYQLFRWAGRVGAKLSPEEVQAAILDPLFGTDGRVGLLGMQAFTTGFLFDALLLPAEISEDAVNVWQVVTDWVLSRDEGSRPGEDYVDRHFTICACATLFCVGMPLVCVVEEGWSELSRFIPVIERAVRRFGRNSTLYLGVLRFFERGGFDLLPDPGLMWLAEIAVDRKQDQAFWNDNGDETAQLLKKLLESKPGQLTAELRAAISLISDILVDNGVRGAGSLQQGQLRR